MKKKQEKLDNEMIGLVKKKKKKKSNQAIEEDSMGSGWKNVTKQSINENRAWPCRRKAKRRAFKDKIELHEPFLSFYGTKKILQKKK